jgi:hypothetical protein
VAGMSTTVIYVRRLFAGTPVIERYGDITTVTALTLPKRGAMPHKNPAQAKLDGAP